MDCYFLVSRKQFSYAKNFVVLVKISPDRSSGRRTSDSGLVYGHIDASLRRAMINHFVGFARFGRRHIVDMQLSKSVSEVLPCVFGASLPGSLTRQARLTRHGLPAPIGERAPNPFGWAKLKPAQPPTATDKLHREHRHSQRRRQRRAKPPK